MRVFFASFFYEFFLRVFFACFFASFSEKECFFAKVAGNSEDVRKPEEISQTKLCLNEKELRLNLKYIVEFLIFLEKNEKFLKESRISVVKKRDQPKNRNEFRGMSVPIGKFHSKLLGFFHFIEEIFVGSKFLATSLLE